jgi:SAM-dependent methyltransferase
MDDTPTYLAPYRDAARRNAGGFCSLLWASPQTQAARFAAICRATKLAERSVLDVGCGRADLLDYLLSHEIKPADYIGIEVIPELLVAARNKSHRHARIIEADFIKDPRSLFVGADVVVFSGSLNTLDRPAFYTTIRRAFDAAAEVLVFNFLDSASLAAASYLTWHSQGDVLTFAQSLSPRVRVLSDYLDGDSTISITKDDVHA